MRKAIITSLLVLEENVFKDRDLGFSLRCGGRPKPPDGLSPAVGERDRPMRDEHGEERWVNALWRENKN